MKQDHQTILPISFQLQRGGYQRCNCGANLTRSEWGGLRVCAQTGALPSVCGDVADHG
jgi:hypothetical protein